MNYVIAAMAGCALFVVGVFLSPTFNSNVVSYDQFMDAKCGVQQKVGCLTQAVAEWDMLAEHKRIDGYR